MKPAGMAGLVDAFPYLIPYLLGFVVAKANDDRGRIGDRVAGTRVIGDCPHPCRRAEQAGEVGLRFESARPGGQRLKARGDGAAERVDAPRRPFVMGEST